MDSSSIFQSAYGAAITHITHIRWIELLLIWIGLSMVYLAAMPWLSSLRKFPGPLAAKYTSFWIARQCRQTRRSIVVMNEHAKHGDFVRIAPNHISINNPAAATEIYGHKSGCLKSDFYDAFLQVTPVVFNATSVSMHQRKRKYINPAFSARALSDFEPHMTCELIKWRRALFAMADKAEGSTVVDFVAWTNYLAFDIIGSFSFGTSFGFIERGHDPYNLIATIDTRGEVLNALGSLPTWIRPWMKYNYFDSFWSSGLRATANLEKIGRNAYQTRKAAGKGRSDLLSYLLRAQDGNDPISDSEIIAESISFIVGGSDTTSSTMTNFIDFVSRDQPLQRRIQQEIDNAFPGEQDDDWVAPNKIAENLPLLVGTLREVMRIRPTSATGLPRVVPEGGKMIAGRFLPGGVTVSMPTSGLLTDERVFPNASEFRPERWSDANAHTLLDHFLPFSTGPRACIGRSFAWMEILKSLATLFKLFDVERVNKEPTLVREGFFNKATECRCTLKKR